MLAPGYESFLEDSLKGECAILSIERVRAGRYAGDPILVVQRSDGSLWDAVLGCEAEPWGLLGHQLALADYVRHPRRWAGLDLQALSAHIAHLEAMQVVEAAERIVSRAAIQRRIGL